VNSASLIQDVRFPPDGIVQITLAPFTPNHADDIVALWRASFEAAVGVRETHTVAEQRAYLLETVAPRNKIVVACANDGVVGFVASSSECIDQLYVHVDFQRNGVGSELLQWAKGNSSGRLSLFTFESNHQAQRFYERRGFKVAARGFEPHWQLPDIRYEWNREPGMLDRNVSPPRAVST
jgi:ribosomal protein S18 acetylase RimI-like enzyme